MPPPPAIDVHAVTDTSAVTLPDPLTVNAVTLRRAQAAKLNGGVAAYSTSDFFKSQGALSEESKSRKPSSLKATARHLKTPGIISLGGALPSSEYFPIDHFTVKVPAVPHFSEPETHSNGKTLEVGKHDVSEGKGAYDLEIALNYGQAIGSAQMLRFVTEHTEIIHRPKYQDWQCVMTIGNTSALDIAFRMFTMPGQYIMMEEYTFSSAMETARPMGVKIIGIKMDAEGLIPEHMDELLTSWDEQAHDGAKKPFLLYTVPCGQNPTGATQGLERRKQVYAVAQKHDVYILEDDPYYFLQMQPYQPGQDGTSTLSLPSTHEEFLAALIPSFLSLDTDGRVMRMDSFSKVISPGIRTGCITASEQVVERVVRHQEMSVQNPSGLSQLTLYKLLDEHWGHGGYLEWLVYLRGEYTRRRDVMLRACERHLPKEVVQWNPPAAGMFLWLKISWHLHPLARQHFQRDNPAAQEAPNMPSSTVEVPHDIHGEIEQAIFDATVKQGVLVCKGSWFKANPFEEKSNIKLTATPRPAATSAHQSEVDVKDRDSNDEIHESMETNANAEKSSSQEMDREMFFRTTFAAAHEGAMDEGIRRLGEALRQEFSLH